MPPPKDVKLIICCGMSRSGSTLQYQIVKAIMEQAGWGKGVGFPNKWDKKSNAVVKSERPAPWLLELVDDGTAMGLSIHRDPRQVALSLLGFYIRRAEYHDWPPPTWDDIMVEHLPNAIEWHNEWMAHGARSFCYESYQPHFGKLAIACAKTLDMDIPHVELATIAFSLSLSRQRLVMGDLLKWIDNEGTLLTKGHIAPRSRGWETWQQLLTVDQVFDVQETQGVQEWMRRWGYNLVEFWEPPTPYVLDTSEWN